MERYLGDVGDIIGKIAIWRPSILPRPRARRRQHFGSGRADEYSDSGYVELSGDEYSDGGSGELSGDNLARFHGLILPRSRGFGDKQPLERSWATSSVMVIGRRTYLGRWRIYPTSSIVVLPFNV
ncbi:hypothetical protein Acr_09g0006040 [Actinidia rufa]|uniref:Uncharacterized protein n=1 Tax=Actinidia rufa TaxID=165716 RepID=A0A7J0F620_9ERIC|nr:hypothetical protein Acr_09g0006040 [Actinidia rufa]